MLSGIHDLVLNSFKGAMITKVVEIATIDTKTRSMLIEINRIENPFTFCCLAQTLKFMLQYCTIFVLHDFVQYCTMLLFSPNGSFNLSRNIY